MIQFLIEPPDFSENPFKTINRRICYKHFDKLRFKEYLVKVIGMVLALHRMKKRIFVFRKFVRRTEKIIFSLVFVCFRFTEISYFLNFPSNENVRKQHLSTSAYFYVNMIFSYTIGIRQLDIKMKFCRIVTKASDFLLVFRSTFC